MAVLVPSPRLTSDPFNERHITRTPVERTRVLIAVVPDGAATVTTTKGVHLNGKVTNIITAAPPIPTDANFTVALIDEDGVTKFTTGNIADDSNVDTDLVSSNLFLVGQYTLKVTFSTVLSGNTATFDIRFTVVTP